MTDSILNGSDLLLYVNTGTGEAPVWTPVANATSHQITKNAETKERVTKDTGRWKNKKVTSLSVSIKCDVLVANDAQSYGFNELNAIWNRGEEVLLKYAIKEGKTKAGDHYEQGLFVITSLDQTAAANEDVTMTASFENSGEIEIKTVTAPVE